MKDHFFEDVLGLRGEEKEPGQDYRKKVLNPGCDCPLTETFTHQQVERRIAFYKELNRKRESLPREQELIEKKFALYGWKDTTTVRVYLRETVSKIAAELFYSSYSIAVENVHFKSKNGKIDKDHGYVVAWVRATVTELKALFEYIKPSATFFVYDGEESKYVPGDTATSEFIITKPEDPVQPKKFWRRSQSFIFRIEELDQ
jgi:hypothetical protein